jgi:hypothetical protein
MKLVTPVVGPRRTLAVAVAAIISDRPLPSPAESLPPLSLAQCGGIVPHQIALLSSRRIDRSLAGSDSLCLLDRHTDVKLELLAIANSISFPSMDFFFFFSPTWLCDNLCLPIRGEEIVLYQTQPSLSPAIDQICTTNHM